MLRSKSSQQKLWWLARPSPRHLGVCSVVHGLSHMVAGMEVMHGPTIWTSFPKADVAATDVKRPICQQLRSMLSPNITGFSCGRGLTRMGLTGLNIYPFTYSRSIWPN